MSTAFVAQFIIGLLGSANPGFWFDEAASLSIAKRSVPDIMRLLANKDAVNGLYYLFLHPWIALFGQSELSVRSLSALALAVAAAGFALLAQRFGLGWPATTAFLVCPGLSWCATEARGVAFSVAAVVWSFVLLQRAVESERWLIDFISFGVVLGLAICFQLYAAALLPVHALLVWFSGTWRKHYWHLITSWVVGFVVSSPVIIFGFWQRGQVSWIHNTPAGVLKQIRQMQVFRGQVLNISARTGDIQRIVCYAAWAFVIVGIFFILKSGVRSALANSCGVGAAWFAIPTLLVALPTLIPGFDLDIYQLRYLTFATPGFCLLFAAAWNAVPGRRLIASCIAGLLAMGCVPTLVAQRQPNAKESLRATAEAAAGCDTVVFTNTIARSVLVSYPDSFRNCTDIEAGFSAASANAYWDLSRDEEYLGQGAHGSTAVLYRSAAPEELVNAGQALSALGCTATADSFVAPRVSIAIWQCP
ncbi:MAG: hypothetical protein LBJ43_03650 [Propionibacteriaceae bacterium]|nr:hypothetical protein [Propionibacteriaceae bacterium]